jgi:hypothetical protein
MKCSGRGAKTTGCQLDDTAIALSARAGRGSTMELVGEDREVETFNELTNLLRGMRGQMVEAAIFLPWDDGRFPVAGFSGTLHEVEYRDGSIDPRWVLSWIEDGQGKPRYPEVAVWERRYVRAELEFTGDPDEGLAEIDESRGHNIFPQDLL